MEKPGIRISIETFDGATRIQEVVFDQREMVYEALLDFQRKVVFPVSKACLEWTAAKYEEAVALQAAKGKG
jgi:hypothetical protein